MSDYRPFLERKLITAPAVGFDVAAADLSPVLFDWQREVVSWALARGRAAIFGACGTGKTLLQLEWARQLTEQGERVLILAPLAVAHQTIREGEKLGLPVEYRRSQEDYDADGAAAVVITNYEMLEHFDPSQWGGVVLDESSILKSFAGKTKRALLEAFAETPYRLCCTATPAPNDHIELGNHAAFLGVMAVSEMMARWFKHDSGDTSKWRLKRHGEADFWRWVSSWAVCFERPSDLGDHEDGGFALPPLIIEGHVLANPQRAADKGMLFLGDAAPSATEMWADKKETAKERCERAAEIVATKPEAAWTVWCETNHESDILKKLLPYAVEVRGSDSIAEKERKLDAFADGEARVIISKASIAGFGLNWQHCSDVVFVGLTYSFEALYQAIRRSWRYGQHKAVTVHLISAESDQGIVASVRAKQAEHEAMVARMVAATRQYGLAARESHRDLSLPVEDEYSGEGWRLLLGDAVARTAELPSNSVDLSVFSPPFANLYVYSDSVADMGNSKDADEFFKHLGFLLPELHRITKPGRLCCVHCSELPRQKGVDGVMGIYDFPGDVVKAFEAVGWVHVSRITVWKDPVVEMARTKAMGLLHKSFTQRREAVRVGMPDYVLVFRKWTDDMPDRQVAGGMAPIGSYIGEDAPTMWTGDRDYSIQTWQKYASPVWMDIRQGNVLEYAGAREQADERHICPLQLDVIHRCIWLWSNPGDVVFDPFMGIGSTGYVALQTGRRALGVELKPSYAAQAVRHLERAVREKDQGTLFGEAV